MIGPCSECGENRPLTDEGVCTWRAGCEHRVRRREAQERRAFEEVVSDLHFDSFLRDLGFHLPGDEE